MPIVIQMKDALYTQPRYNAVRYNTVLDITWLKDGSQKCKDYIEKMTINGHFYIVFTFLFGYNTVVSLTRIIFGSHTPRYNEVVVYCYVLKLCLLVKEKIC